MLLVEVDIMVTVLLVANISAQLTGGKLGLAELTALPTLVMVTAN